MRGYATFSTAGFETVRLARTGRTTAAAANGLGMLAVPVAAAAGGVTLGTLHRPPRLETNKLAATFDICEIEIPRRRRYRGADHATGRIRLDRAVFTSMVFPQDYGLDRRHSRR
ncbi:hypothetical protein QP157_21100 [Sphingomonas sp. LR61]|uniref:hypothetical protein n=1 Tax=Sphingomonas sp. LR61 TaxID=3050234 RepID=UPI002FE24515